MTLDFFPFLDSVIPSSNLTRTMLHLVRMSRPALESSDSSELSSILPNSSPDLAYLAVLPLEGVADIR